MEPHPIRAPRQPIRRLLPVTTTDQQHCVRCGKVLDPAKDPGAPLLKRCADCFTSRTNPWDDLPRWDW